MEEAPRYERLRRWLYPALLLAFVFAPVLYFWARGEPSEPVGELETRRSREPSEAAPADAMLQGTEAPRAGTEAPAAELENESRTDRSPRVLRGVVRSAEGTELEGADVFILRKDEGESWQTLTAGDGRFDRFMYIPDSKVENLGDDVFLGVKVIVETAGFHIRRCGNIAQRSRGEAVFVEHSGGGIEDARARRILPALFVNYRLGQ